MFRRAGRCALRLTSDEVDGDLVVRQRRQLVNIRGLLAEFSIGISEGADRAVGLARKIAGKPKQFCSQ